MSRDDNLHNPIHRNPTSHQTSSSPYPANIDDFSKHQEASEVDHEARDTLLELTISAVAYGGKGVARLAPDLARDGGAWPSRSEDSEHTGNPVATGPTPSPSGKVYFVEGAVTGDRVLARVTQDEGRYGEATLVKMLAKSPLRGTAHCPYEQECGGCQWMAISYDQQLEWKKSFVESALKRIGKLDVDIPVNIIPSPSRYAYRNRILVRAHWHPHQVEGDSNKGTRGQLEVGYFARGTRRLVPIDRCEIAAPALNIVLDQIRLFTFSELPHFRARLELQEVAQQSSSSQAKVVITVYPAEGPREAAQDLVKKLQQLPMVAWAGLVFDLGTAPRVDFDHDLGLSFSTIPGQFQQINMELNRTLRRLVKDQVEKTKARRVLDLCCGSGNLSLPIADGQRYVEAIEFNKKAIVCAHRNVEKNNLNNICFLTGDSEKHLWKVARSGEVFDLVILDPPRQGMYKGMVPLKMLAPEHIIYVSCDPTTLARDLGYLLRKDTYKIESVTALDFFPNTYHVETVVFLRRNSTSVQ